MIKIKEISTNEFAKIREKKFPESDFLQSPKWGEAYRLTGFKVFYLAFYNDGDLHGIAMAIKHNAKRGTYLEIPGGPLCNFNCSESKDIIEALKDFAKKQNCVFVRIRPNLLSAPENISTFQNLGLKIAPLHIHPDCTTIIDLSQSEEDLLKNFRRQTRYEVKQAIKKDIKIDICKTEKEYKEFYQCQVETARRQGFIPSSGEFILALKKSFGDKTRLYKSSTKEGDVLAYALVLLEKPRAVYIEAASTPANFRQPGAYALQWQIIRDAKKIGLKEYDLFGIAPAGEENHRYSGVTTFKNGFGGKRIMFIPDFDIVINPFRYQITRIIEKIRKTRRHL